MDLSKYKTYIPTIVIALVFGYFLGITISAVVDYRLKDAVINLPKPKNNITIKLDESSINELKNGEIKETFNGSKKLNRKVKVVKSKKITNSGASTNENKEQFKAFIETPKQKDKKKKKKEKKDKEKKEGFIGGKSEQVSEEDVSKIDNIAYLENINYNKNQLTDPNINAYAMAYKLSNKMAQSSLTASPYVPANYEDSEQSYLHLSSMANYKLLNNKEDSVKNNNIKNLETSNNVNSIVNYDKLKRDKPKGLPDREERKIDFKGQRPWVNTTNKVNRNY